MVAHQASNLGVVSSNPSGVDKKLAEKFFTLEDFHLGFFLNHYYVSFKVLRVFGLGLKILFEYVLVCCGERHMEQDQSTLWSLSASNTLKCNAMRSNATKQC